MATANQEQGLLSFLDRMEAQSPEAVGLDVGMARYLDYYARERGVPLRGVFELTPRCNLDCRMCYVHLTERQLQESGRTPLTGSQWKGIMAQAIDAGMLNVLLTGGETLLHPDFDDIYLYLQGRGIEISVNTNGTLLTPERVAFFRKHPPKVLRVTLYGADEDAYERVTGHRAFDRTLQGIIRARDAGLRLNISITPNRYMEDGGVALVHLAQSTGVPYVINSFLSEPREETGRDGDAHDVTVDDYIRLYLLKLAQEGKQPRPIPAGELPAPGGGIQESPRGLRCSGGRSAFAVLWNGMMQPCLSYTQVQADVLSVPFGEAWRSINEHVKQVPLPMECEGCPYRNICPVCVVLHAEGAPAGHANPALCRRAMQMLTAGLGKIHECT